MPSPFESLAGDEWESLAPAVRLAHSVPLIASGTLCVKYGANCLIRFIKLPPVGDSVQTSLKVEQTARGVLWTRNFGGTILKSVFKLRGHEIHECAGLFRLGYRLIVQDGTVTHRHIGTWFLGIPIPKGLGPQVKGFVSSGSDIASWRVDVKIWHFLLGPICHYEGEMRAE